MKRINFSAGNCLSFANRRTIWQLSLQIHRSLFGENSQISIVQLAICIRLNGFNEHTNGYDVIIISSCNRSDSGSRVRLMPYIVAVHAFWFLKTMVSLNYITFQLHHFSNRIRWLFSVVPLWIIKHPNGDDRVFIWDSIGDCSFSWVELEEVQQQQKK